MVYRLLFAVLAIGALGTLFYLSDSGSGEAAPADVESTEPGYIATGAELVETGEDGQPLYRLHAARIEQPTPQGMVFLSEPQLDYQPVGGNHWTLSAQRGQLPQDARSADMAGSVVAFGRPEGSSDMMHIATEQLHLDMRSQVVSTSVKVRVDWAGNTLHSRGMSADIRNGRLQLPAEVHGALTH